MNVIARWFVYVVIGLGSIVLATRLTEWNTEDASRFVCYALVTLVASSLRLTIPTFAGTISANFLFILIAIVELTLPETLVIGFGATLVQCLFHVKRRLHPMQVAFNVASMIVAIAVAARAHELHIVSDHGINSGIALLLTAVAFFGMNTFPIATVVGFLEHRTTRVVWREYYFASLPYYVAGALIAGLMHYANQAVGWQTSLLITPVLYLLYRSFVLYVSQMDNGKRHAEELAALNFRTIEALALAIEAKDHTTHDHLRRVQVYAMEIGKELGLSPVELDALRAAALLHDIGKLAVPEHIISKPGRLTPEEFEKMKIHPVVGAEILERVEFPYPVVPIVRSHHEKWNGTGYPDGLRAEEIPIGARILSAVDCLDALASDRQYRKALPLDEAMRRVAAEAGTSFDPSVVEILARRYVELERMAVSDSNEVNAKLSVDVKIHRGHAPAAGFADPLALPPAEKRRAELDCIETIVSARQQVQMLFELAASNAMNISLDEALSVFAVRLKQLVPFDTMAVYMRSGEVVVPSYVTGDEYRLFSGLRIPIGQGLSGWALENAKTILNGNPAVEPGYLNDPKMFTKLRSALVVPLTGLNGAIGVLALYHHDRDAYSQEQLRVLQAISSKLAFVAEKFADNLDAGSVVPSDTIAALPDARDLFLHLEDKLQGCAASQKPLAVIVCTLHGFNLMRERCYPDEVQAVLEGVGHALYAVCETHLGYLAHTGSDEFVVVLPGVSLDRMNTLCLQLSQAVQRVTQIVPNGSSIQLLSGAAHYPEDGELPEELLAEADRKVARAKNKLPGQSLRVMSASTVGTWRTALMP